MALTAEVLLMLPTPARSRQKSASLNLSRLTQPPTAPPGQADMQDDQGDDHRHNYFAEYQKNTTSIMAQQLRPGEHSSLFGQGSGQTLPQWQKQCNGRAAPCVGLVSEGGRYASSRGAPYQRCLQVAEPGEDVREP
mmetsp:Transcript_40619/g.75599  ORF Transcript_40619/g.75599 Transcript_40619/m.75599 type:complete len:136 (-) Transcript_40619:402-809(-)